jgi:predicted TIM-barrel fold metal-dependent hydrolase
MLKFFDCNAFLGRSARRAAYQPVPSAEAFLGEMDFCGVDKALVWHIAQFDASPQSGNELISKAIQPHPRLLGCWSLLPNQAGEFPAINDFLSAMRRWRIVALRAFPLDHHFMLNEVAMGSWLKPMIDHRIPLFLSVARGSDWNLIYALMSEFPDLVCVICDHGCWGEDRRFRPLIERYPHVYIDTACYLLDGGIESFTADYGAQRILFGSGFPEAHFGGMMMAIKHAQISDQDRQNIASRNLERILSEVLW